MPASVFHGSAKVLAVLRSWPSPCESKTSCSLSDNESIRDVVDIYTKNIQLYPDTERMNWKSLTLVGEIAV